MNRNTHSTTRPLRFENSAYEATKSRKRSSLFYQMADSLTRGPRACSQTTWKIRSAIATFGWVKPITPPATLVTSTVPEEPFHRSQTASSALPCAAKHSLKRNRSDLRCSAAPRQVVCAQSSCDTTEFRRGIDEATIRTHEMLKNLQESLWSIKIRIKL